MTCMASNVLLLLLLAGLTGSAFARLPLEASTFFSGNSNHIIADDISLTSGTKWVLLAGSRSYPNYRHRVFIFLPINLSIKYVRDITNFSTSNIQNDIIPNVINKLQPPH